MAGIPPPSNPFPLGRQGLTGHRPSISHGETVPHPPAGIRDTMPRPPPSPPLPLRQPSGGFRSPAERRRLSYNPGFQASTSQGQTEDYEELPEQFRGFKGRKPSLIPQSSSRRFSTGWEDMEIVSKIHDGTLSPNFFEKVPTKQPRRKSVAVPTYAYLSKDFVKTNAALAPNDVESAGPTSKRRGTNAEIRLQEAAWRHHQKLAGISSRCRKHFKKVEEVKLNTDESDKKEMDRILAATKKIYK